MKNLTNRLVSFMLVFALALSLSAPAFAAEYSGTNELENEIDTADDIQAAREAYYALSPEAKEIFDATLADTPKLLEFHQTYVDENFVVPVQVRPQAAAAAGAVAADPMTVLMAELSALALPTSVLYSLKAVGAGMVAAIADGPLPVGDILLAAAAVSAATVIAANWNQVSPLWNSVVRAFQKAFATSANNVLTAFNEIKNQVLKIVTPTLSYNQKDKTVTYGNTTYRCQTKVSSLTEQQKKAGVYYVALRIGTMLYCDTSHPVSAKTAKAVLSGNNSFIGILATSKSLALDISSPILRNDTAHDPSKPGYFPHYHPDSAKNAHCWYLIPA